MRWEESDLTVEDTDHPLPAEILRALELLEESDAQIDHINLNRKRYDRSGKIGKSYEKFARLADFKPDVDTHERIAAAIVAATLEMHERDGARSTGKFQIKLSYREDEGEPLESTSIVFGVADATPRRGSQHQAPTGGSDPGDLARRTVNTAVGALERALQDANRRLSEARAQIAEEREKADKRIAEERERADKRVAELEARWQAREKEWAARLDKAEGSRDTMLKETLELGKQGMRPTAEFADTAIGIAAGGLAMMQQVQKEKISIAESTAETEKGERQAQLADKAIDKIGDIVDTMVVSKLGLDAKKKRKKKGAKKTVEKENEKTDGEKTDSEPQVTDNLASAFDPRIAEKIGELFESMGDGEWSAIAEIYGSDARELLEEIEADKSRWTLREVKAFIDEEILCDFGSGANMTTRINSLRRKFGALPLVTLFGILDILQEAKEAAEGDAKSDESG